MYTSSTAAVLLVKFSFFFGGGGKIYLTVRCLKYTRNIRNAIGGPLVKLKIRLKIKPFTTGTSYCIVASLEQFTSKCQTGWINQ